MRDMKKKTSECEIVCLNKFYKLCTYRFERSLDDDKNVYFITKLIIMFMFRALINNTLFFNFLEQK